MTREEAASIIEDRVRVTEYVESSYVDCVDIEALKMAIEALRQPELPKQFMSDDCISRSELYKTVCEAEKLARERVLDTPSDSPFPNKQNPAYTRYSAQLDERTQFKHMIADAQSVQPENIRCKDCLHWVRTCGDNKWGLGDCDVFDKHLVMCEGYCAWAERREA